MQRFFEASSECPLERWHCVQSHQYVYIRTQGSDQWILPYPISVQNAIDEYKWRRLLDLRAFQPPWSRVAMRDVEEVGLDP